MNENYRIAITGTGSLAEALIHAIIAYDWQSSICVTILGRDKKKVDWLTLSANARAWAISKPINFCANVIDWSEIDLLPQMLNRLQPKLIIHTASLQSPWDLAEESSKWGSLVESHGFGTTALLHAMLTLRLARAIQHCESDIQLVNACYPDFVNPLISLCGLPIVSGLGNVAILAAVIASKLPHKQSIKIMAHHRHIVEMITTPSKRSHNPRLWIDNVEVEPEPFLNTVQLPGNSTLNAVTAYTAMPMISALCGLSDYNGHAPGPLGLPGGYPVNIKNSQLRLALPDGISFNEAVQWNQQKSLSEGIAINSVGDVFIDRQLHGALVAYDEKFPEIFPVKKIDIICQRLLNIRTRMKGNY